ncbi:hypothetical protein [Algibacter pectinivorans]|uniref:Uncharacterized protein n=1 Tax=Algibacter pectinivorans TaxID=870482 RepID=A0A1I1NA44_9FLAO|nr:hypothetical protein [Algibacter pectinivorans]SFC94604.1 hypothetical protein SAMN04487987_102140 [Algibacter pectinivorans]
MKNKLQVLFVAITLLVTIGAQANDRINSSLNLSNPDVRKCLIESTESEGWKMAALYYDANKKLVMIFEKGEDSKTYISK